MDGFLRRRLSRKTGSRCDFQCDSSQFASHLFAGPGRVSFMKIERPVYQTCTQSHKNKPRCRGFRLQSELLKHQLRQFFPLVSPFGSICLRHFATPLLDKLWGTVDRWQKTSFKGVPHGGKWILPRFSRASTSA